MGSFADTNHPMYIPYTGSKMKVGTLVRSEVKTFRLQAIRFEQTYNP